MRWSTKELEEYNARRAAKRRVQTKSEDSSEGRSAQPEPPIQAGPLEEKKTEGDDRGFGGEGKQKFLVEVIAYRKRLLDMDNACVKYHIDGLRYGGVLPDDNHTLTEIRVRQVKSKEVKTELIVWERL